MFPLAGEFWRARRRRQDAFDCPALVSAARRHPFDTMNDLACWRACTVAPSKKGLRKIPVVVMKSSHKSGKRQPAFPPAMEAFPSAWKKNGSPVAYYAVRWYLNSWPLGLAKARLAAQTAEDVDKAFAEISSLLQLQDEEFDLESASEQRLVLRALRKFILEGEMGKDAMYKSEKIGGSAMSLSPAGSAASPSVVR